ncbi:oxalate--CoA ligase [Trichomonascus vanleenenianus]|uniref:acyl--CoA ligase n=1 Tax=Trichomonascus vanleenenianus TaxID=2268995 RepID=UPI003EC9BA3A
MAYSSLYGPLKDPYYGNAAQFIRESPHILANPDKKVFIDAKTGEYLTAKGLCDLMGQIAYLLHTKYDIKYDDVVCVFARNSIYTAPTYHGVLSIGAVVSPANVVYLPHELGHQLSATKTKLLVTSDELRKTAEAAAKEQGVVVSNIITMEQLVQEARACTEQLLPVPIPGLTAVNKDAFYCFSSGTSGTPKGVMTSHHNMTSNHQQQVQSMPQEMLSPDHVFAGVLPMSHIFALGKFVFQNLVLARTVVVFSKFQLEELLQAIIKYRITHMFSVPPIIVLLAKSPIIDKYPEVKDSLTALYSGAAPLSKSLIDQVEQRLGVDIKQGYGLTESSPVSHSANYDPKTYNKDSIGWLIAGQEARVVDPDGNDVAPGERGELWMRGPNIMRGYLNNPEATANTLTKDGWLKTGDVAVVDEHHQFYIVDRVKELIKSKGHQVAPAELEYILLKHPNVSDSAVIGIYSEDDASELPRAFVTLNKSIDPLEIKNWFDKSVARYKQLWGGIVVLDAIPKSPSGKILRRELRLRKGDTVYGMKRQAKM